MPAPKEYWGVDIGGHAVKAVKVQRTNEKLQLVAADIVDLKGEAVSEVSFGRDRRIWIALNELAQRQGIRNERLVISVPGRATFVRPFDVLLVTGKPEEELVRFEIQQHIPFGLDTVIWDHEIFAAREDGHRRDGMMFALKKEVLNNYLMNLNAATLQADDVQSAPIALYNFVKYDLQPEEPVLLVNIGATCTDLVLMHESRYTMSLVATGGDAITRVLQEQLKLTPEGAEKAKRRVAELKAARKVLETMLPAMRKYANDVQSAVRRLRSGVGDIQPRKALLFGGGASTVGLEKIIAQALECEAETPKKLGKIEIPDETVRAYVEAHASELAVAIGLAMHAAGEGASPISLISTSAMRKKIASRSKKFVAATLGAFAVMLLWLGIAGGIEASRLEVASTRLKAVMDPIQKRADQWRALTSESPAQKEISEYTRMMARRLCMQTILTQISSVLPPANRMPGNDAGKVWLLDLKLDPKGASVNVVSWWGVMTSAGLDFAQSKVLPPLKDKPGFMDVKMEIVGKDRQGYKFVNDFMPGAPFVLGGKYMIFPITFSVDLDKLEKGGPAK